MEILYSVHLLEAEIACSSGYCFRKKKMLNKNINPIRKIRVFLF